MYLAFPNKLSKGDPFPLGSSNSFF